MGWQLRRDAEDYAAYMGEGVTDDGPSPAERDIVRVQCARCPASVLVPVTVAPHRWTKRLGDTWWCPAHKSG